MDHIGAVHADKEGRYRLSIEAGEAGAFRLAEISDYSRQPRHSLNWQAPCALELRARVSAPKHPGTWGFGFWNNPFSAGLPIRGGGLLLPALPNCAWFFHASPQNYLSFRDDRPASGMLAAVFSSPRIPSGLLAPGLIGAPLLALPVTARLLRKALSRLVGYDAAQLDLYVTSWHTYRVEAGAKVTRFQVDGSPVFETHLSARGRLGLVIWIDNQYAAFRPEGRLETGTLYNPPVVLEGEGLKIQNAAG